MIRNMRCTSVLLAVFALTASISTVKAGVNRDTDISGHTRGIHVDATVSPESGEPVILAQGPGNQGGQPPMFGFVPPPYLVSKIDEETSKEPGYHGRLMVMMHLVDYLNLDENTAAELFPLYNQHQIERFDMNRRFREMTSDITKKADDESVPVRELRRDLARLDALDGEIERSRDAFMKKAESMLDERQYIKLIVFDDKLKDELVARFIEMGLRNEYEDARRRYEDFRRDNPGGRRD